MAFIKFKKVSDEVIGRFNDDINNGATQYNTVYRQASTNLLVVAGILLALSTAIVGQLTDAEVSVKILAMSTIGSLAGSLAFGVIQQLIEAEYFRKDALRKISLAKKVSSGEISGDDYIAGRLDEIDARKGQAVSRWASIVQLCLMGVALCLMLVIVAIFLFS